MEQVIATEKYCTNLHRASLSDGLGSDQYGGSEDLQCMEDGDQDHMGSAEIHPQLPGAGSAFFWSPESQIETPQKLCGILSEPFEQPQC